MYNNSGNNDKEACKRAKMSEWYRRAGSPDMFFGGLSQTQGDDYIKCDVRSLDVTGDRWSICLGA